MIEYRKVVMAVIVIMVFIWLVNQFHKPILFAVLYSGIGLVYGLVFSAPLMGLLISSLISLVYFGLFFSILEKFSETIFTWCGIVVGGILLWFGILFMSIRAPLY